MKRYYQFGCQFLPFPGCCQADIISRMYATSTTHSNIVRALVQAASNVRPTAWQRYTTPASILKRLSKIFRALPQDVIFGCVADKWHGRSRIVFLVDNISNIGDQTGFNGVSTREFARWLMKQDLGSCIESAPAGHPISPTTTQWGTQYRETARRERGAIPEEASLGHLRGWIWCPDLTKLAAARKILEKRLKRYDNRKIAMLDGNVTRTSRGAVY